MRMARTVAVAVSSATPGSVSVSSADPSSGPGPAAASVWGTAGSCAGRAPVHCTVLYTLYCIVLYLATERGRGYGPHLLVPGRLLRQYQHYWCPIWTQSSRTRLVVKYIYGHALGFKSPQIGEHPHPDLHVLLLLLVQENVAGAGWSVARPVPD